MVITPKLITIFTVLSTQTVTYNFIYSDKLYFRGFSMLIYSISIIKFPKQKKCWCVDKIFLAIWFVWIGKSEKIKKVLQDLVVFVNISNATAIPITVNHWKYHYRYFPLSPSTPSPPQSNQPPQLLFVFLKFLATRDNSVTFSSLYHP